MRIADCEFPDGLLYYAEGTMWAAEAEGEVRLGITNLLSWSFGVFASVRLKEAGTELQRGGILGSLEGARHFDVLRSPLSGTVTKTNDALVPSPRLLNSFPYSEGWLAQMRPDDPSELDALNPLPSVASSIAEGLRVRGIHCFVRFPDLELFEIGVECSAALVRLNEVLRPSEAGTVVHVVSDDPSADIEMERWADETGNKFLEHRKDGSIHHFIVSKAG